MFRQEEVNYSSAFPALGYTDDVRYGEASSSSKTGQKMILESSGQAPTAVQRMALALVSLGMLMGTTILLTILAAESNEPAWVLFPLLFVLALFTAAVVSINVVFGHRI